MKNIINFLQKNKGELLLLVLILGLGTFLRFYQFPGHVTFLGDEGRDALVVKKMLLEHKYTLLGPTISFGNLYLGPIYYYFMLPALWLANFDPAGPAAMVILFGIATIFLVWLTGREFFGRVAGVTAGFLYAISPLVITHTRSSWNPNPMPFFALLVIYGLFRALRDKNGWWLTMVGAGLGVALQLHYISLVLVMSVILILLAVRLRLPWKGYLAGLASFFLLLSPQILFELRHNFVNTRAMMALVTRQGEFTAAAGVGFDKLQPLALYQRLITSLLAVNQPFIGLLLAIILGAGAFYLIFKEKHYQTKNLGLFILLMWLGLGVLGVPLYRGPLHDHYLGFLFPAPFLLFGYLANRFWTKSLGKFLVILVIAGLAYLNLAKTNVFSGVGPNYQIDRTRVVSKAIANDVGSQKFNIALSSATKDFFGYNYRYFLELDGKTPEPYDNFDHIDTLYVIEETKWLMPDQLDLWEVGTFGPAEVTKRWEFDFQVQIYRLDHLKK